MLPLRPNKKPQLLPIKQLLLKQKDEAVSRAEDESNLNTDEYLLWKSENESNSRKSVSFTTRKNEIQLRNQNPEFNDDNPSIRSQRLRTDLFLEDTLSDSDEQDNSLHDHLNSLNRIKNYSFGDNPKHTDPSADEPFFTRNKPPKPTPAIEPITKPRTTHSKTEPPQAHFTVLLNITLDRKSSEISIAALNIRYHPRITFGNKSEIGYRSHENVGQLRKQKNSDSSNNWRKGQDANKKLIEAVSLTIREAIDDAEQNLSSRLESKIIEEVSNLKTSLKHDMLQNEVDGKFEKIIQSLANFKEHYHTDLANLRSDLTQRIDTVPSKCISADPRESEERMRSFFMDNLAAAEKNFEKALKAVDSSSHKNESNMEHYTDFFDKNLKKMEELNEKLESLTQATNNVLELITELKLARLEGSTNETPRKMFRSECHTSDVNDVIKSEAFYANIDEELERYRKSYVKSYNGSGHRDTKPAWLATIDEKWRALGVLL